ncbi:MAG: CHAT domain-containing protein [Coleofasciculus sp. C3-bin4]|nr:CHAT domain-containing protein [Coleofasciculus sp. C3-bin4]
MKSLSRYLYRILFRNLLLVFILCTLFGFLMALGVHAATSERSHLSLDAHRMNSGAIQTNPACAGFNLLVPVGGLSLCRSEFGKPNPPAGFPIREGGARLPSPLRGGAGGGVRSLINSPQIVAQSDTQLQNGQALYQAGQFLEAANVWKATASGFESQGDILNQGLVLSYLSLAYQQLGQLSSAEATMGEAVALITAQTLPQSKFILAQILNNQGQLQSGQGQPQSALETWKKSEKLYKELGDRTGEIGTQLNQARALQALGFYLRARTTLEQIEASLKSQPASQLKVAGLLNLGNVLRVAGDFDASQKILEQGCAIAQQLKSLADIQLALFSLANLAEAQEQSQTALKYYQQAAAENSPVRLQAQIHQLNLLVKLNRLQEVQTLLPLIQTQLANLPPSQTKIYAQIELADSLVKLNPKEVTTAAQLLATAEKQAKILGNPRAESYAVGRLGQLYFKTQQWEEAKRLTQEALSLTQAIRAPEIAYQWQWQMGQLLVKTGDRLGAIAAYTEAVNTLQSLRQDLVAINQDVQFSFREQVEPVYRELVDLLLQDTPDTSLDQRQKNLSSARATLEELQLAKLSNFFREACLDSKPQSIDQFDPTAAVIYPIILRDRLEVILSLHGNQLRHYSTNLPQKQVEDVINRMRQSLRQTSFAQERLSVAQELYSWLVQPAAADLSRQSIKTLVFVLDGSLRNLPMAALHDGKQYLIEQYRIAIAPSLQLFNPQSLALTQLKVLVGGLTQGSQEFSALPGVKQEVSEISAEVPATTLLDQQFTAAAVQAKVKTQSFSVMHLATHGQFSSKASETFLLTWDGRLDVKQLSTLLANRDLPDSPPIELLVLSACQTAKGDKRAALGLAGVAVRSGARSTLATLWTVSDESTADFMAQFYQELLKPQVTKAEAVRLAQLHLLKTPKYSHPYYWGAFILVGNWL